MKKFYFRNFSFSKLISTLLLLTISSSISTYNFASSPNAANFAGSVETNSFDNPMGALREKEQEVAGSYVYKTNGANRFENRLEIEELSRTTIRASFEGTYVYQVGGNETFKESVASGELDLNGNAATGNLVEEGSDGQCRVTIAFSVGKAALKSANCDLNIMPDGVYVKTDDNNQGENVGGEFDMAQEPKGSYRKGRMTEISDLFSREEMENCAWPESDPYAGTVSAVGFTKGKQIDNFTLRSTSGTVRIYLSPLLYAERLSKKDSAGLPTLIAPGKRISIEAYRCGKKNMVGHIRAGIDSYLTRLITPPEFLSCELFFGNNVSVSGALSR